MPRAGRLFASTLAVLAIPVLAPAQGATSLQPAATGRPILPAADYGKIETLGASALSPDGQWVAYDVRRGSGGGELRYRRVASDSDRVVPLGSGGTFTSNSRWLLYTISADSASGGGRGGGGSGGRPGGAAAAPGAAPNRRSRAGIVDLRSGSTTLLQDVQSFALSTDGVHVALRRYPPAGRQSRGADLVVRNLEQGTELTFGNVAEYAWSDDGALLAMTIDVDGKTGNGVQVLTAATGTLRSLDAGDMPYVNLQWRARSTDLVAFRVRADSAFVDTSYAVIAWSGVATPRLTKRVYDFAADSTFPKGMRVASYRRPQWADDGSTLYFGIAPREPRSTPAARAKDMPARVEVWHWKDLRTYHQQNRQAQQDQQRTLLAAWHLQPNRVVKLADDLFDGVQLSENGKTVVAYDETPYFAEVISGRSYRDAYLVDVATGTRDRVITKSPFAVSMSPSGRYLLYTQGGHWWSYDRSTGARVSLTEKVPSAFMNMEDDHPVPDRRPYGIGGWITGERSVILYDRFDLWRVNVDGTNPVRLTRGREDSTSYRVEWLDPDVRTIDPARPVFLAATGEYSRKSGYARLVIGKPVQRLLWVDKGVSRLAKAKGAEVYAYVAQTYEESPNLFVGSGALADAKQVSRTNAFLRDYAWGKQILLNYVNGHGDTLQMMLTYPANYTPGQKYPMVVYYYEKLSQGFHQFVAPSERSPYNTSVFSQNGYFVLRPDIKFRPRDPGFSGLDCVRSAVSAVLAMGMVDSARVGNMGHSWGGYQSAFYAVHGRGLFAASIAGAPLTNLVSMYGYTSYNTGAPETGHFETGQERMEVPLWEDPQAYIRNSTVFATDQLQTPLLLEEGDADGNVNYWQSMELYNFGRRLGKNVVFLLYNDENHNVARPESQRDYLQRQLEWFGHYLKGEPAAGWITNGETHLARQKLLKDAGVGRDGAGPTLPAVNAAAGGAGGRGGGS